MSQTIASITLSSQKASIIGDALRSVSDFVDQIIIVDLGTDQATRDEIVKVAGDRAIYIKCDPSASCGEMRNVGLNFAHYLGHTWGLMLDTDERIIPNGINIRETLAHCKQDCVCLVSTDGTYMKEKFFRLPAHYYVGHSHEFIKYDELGVMPNARFDELPKDKETSIKRLKDSLPYLDQQIEQEPNNARWLWYKAFTLEGLGMYREAARVYCKSCKLEMPDRQKAWVMLRLATCYNALGESRLAKHKCLIATLLCKEFCEIYCLLGIIYKEEGNYEMAKEVSFNALKYGAFLSQDIDLSIIRNPYALFEGPFEILKTLSPHPEMFDGIIEEAKKARIAWQRGTH